MSGLGACPHAHVTYVHSWHGLPHTGCGGSHLSLEDAKAQAKPDAGPQKFEPVLPWREYWDFMRVFGHAI